MTSSFEARGAVGNEQLEVARVLLSDEHASHRGEHYEFADVAFYPKAYGDGIPIWVGGEGRPAQRRAGQYGDYWFPYFVRVTPDELRSRYEYATATAAASGREVDLACCLPVEITEKPVGQEPNRLRGTPEQVGEALWRFADVGVRHIGLQFMSRRYPERLAHIEQFAARSGWPGP